jgi:hypothetical protein
MTDTPVPAQRGLITITALTDSHTHCGACGRPAVLHLALYTLGGGGSALCRRHGLQLLRALAAQLLPGEEV